MDCCPTPKITDPATKPVAKCLMCAHISQIAASVIGTMSFMMSIFMFLRSPVGLVYIGPIYLIGFIAAIVASVGCTVFVWTAMKNDSASNFQIICCGELTLMIFAIIFAVFLALDVLAILALRWFGLDVVMFMSLAMVTMVINAICCGVGCCKAKDAKGLLEGIKGTNHVFCGTPPVADMAVGQCVVGEPVGQPVAVAVGQPVEAL